MKISELNSKKRQEWIDITKGISMYFIIAIHNDLIPLRLSIFINSFALVAYFIMAGYLFHNPKNEFQFKKKFIEL
jgi:fucose 4-O-acetylase-like acetyltransferase